MSDPPPKKTTLIATCHCKSSTLSFSVETSALGSLKTHFCHCSICRHTHGTLCSIHTPIPSPPAFDPKSFTTYASSPRVTRYFCSTCGAHMMDRSVPIGEDGNGIEAQTHWCVATSMVDAEESVWDFWAHIWVESTRDEGIATWLPKIGDKELKMFPWGSDGSMEYDEWKKKMEISEPRSMVKGGIMSSRDSDQDTVEEKANPKLRLKCHCGGVEMFVSRPEPGETFKALPPSMIPTDKSKWHASNDVCDSCRLVSGSAIISWFFPLTSHITLPSGSPYRSLFGTAKEYKSSEDVTRTFCGTCGALVSYACDDRPGMIDLGVGLIVVKGEEGDEEGDEEKGWKGARGVRAEEWLEWRTERCSWEEDCRWKGVLEGFKEGLGGLHKK